MFKKIFSLLIATALLLSITACNKNALASKFTASSSPTVTNDEVKNCNEKAMLYLNAESSANYTKALEYYEKALTINPKDTTATNGKKLVELLNELSEASNTTNDKLKTFVAQEIQKSPLFSQLSISTQATITSTNVSSASPNDIVSQVNTSDDAVASQEESPDETMKNVSVEEYLAVLKPRLDQITTTHREIQDKILATITLDNKPLDSTAIAKMADDERESYLDEIFARHMEEIMNNKNLNDYIVDSIQNLNPIIYKVDISFMNVPTNPGLSNLTMKYFNYLSGMYTIIIDSFTNYKYDYLATLLRNDAIPISAIGHYGSNDEKISLFNEQEQTIKGYSGVLISVAHLDYAKVDLRSPLYIGGIYN